MLQDALFAKWEQTALHPQTGQPILVNGKPVTYGEITIDRLFSDKRNIDTLLNRMYGKVKEHIEMSGGLESRSKIDASKLSDDELRTLSKLQAKARVKDD